MHSKMIRDRVVKLRKSGYSYSLISRKTKISKSTLSEWLEDIPYKPNKETLEVLGKARAASSESKARIRRESIVRAKKEALQDIRHISKRDLFLFGLGLYLGEGSKTNNIVRITNADPKVIQSMIFWFKSLGVNVDQFAPRIHLYPDGDLKRSLHFWSKLTTIPKAQFQKAYIDRRVDKKVKKQGKLPFGTLHVGVRSGGRKEFGVFLHRKIEAWNDCVLEQLNNAGLV